VVFVSDSANSRDWAGSKRSAAPRALIHKKILERAGEMPDATMAEVAGEVSGASTDLVERVLQEYGDPAAVESDPQGPTASDGGSASANGATPATDAGTVDGDQPGTGPEEDPSSAGEPTVETAASDAASAGPDDASPGEADAATGDGRADGKQTGEDQAGDQNVPDRDRDEGDGPATDEQAVATPAELTEKEREVLEVVAERPAATQQEVADVLGVSRATVSKRASGIEGFDWQRRAAFVERVFDDETLTRGAGGSSTVDPGTLARADARTDGDRTSSPGDATGSGTSSGATAEVLSRLDRIEDRLDRIESGDASGSDGGITDPELAHKVVHACMESDHVDEDEELRVVAAVLNGDAGD
jgi:hypothetical protein